LATQHRASCGLAGISVRRARRARPGEFAEIVVGAAGRRDTRIVYTGEERGWPVMFRVFATILDRQSRRHSTEAVRYAVERILANGF
jgi:hypothetical protein